MAPCSPAIRTTSRKKSSSTHAVVGLCGKEIRISFGFWIAVLNRSSILFRNSGGSLTGSAQDWPSAMMTPY